VALLHVADRPPGGGNGSRRRTDAGSFFAKQEEALLERLRRVVPGARSLGPGVKRIESAGKADVEILSIAQEEKADLIVLGLSRPSTLRPRIYGSVTCRVVRGANRPVMTVRASDEGGSERRAAQRRAKRP
jgi:nucleotide-binding universal stress UspA family protein